MMWWWWWRWWWWWWRWCDDDEDDVMMMMMKVDFPSQYFLFVLKLWLFLFRAFANDRATCGCFLLCVVLQKQSCVCQLSSSCLRVVRVFESLLSAAFRYLVTMWSSFSRRSWKYSDVFTLCSDVTVVLYRCKGFSFDKDVGASWTRERFDFKNKPNRKKTDLSINRTKKIKSVNTPGVKAWKSFCFKTQF